MTSPKSAKKSLALSTGIEKWPYAAPFRITGRTSRDAEVLVVCLEKDGCVGRAEAAGVPYRNETAASMSEQLESTRSAIEAGMSRDAVQGLLPPGGARNALDCALWDLEAKLSGQPVWQMAGLQEPRPLLTTFTCGADSPEAMAAKARAYADARAIKLKLTGEPIDADRVRAVRAARKDVWLGVDANQGLTRGLLEGLLPVLLESKVALIEQPFLLGQDALLDGFQSPIPIAADESFQTLADLPGLVGRFDLVNIKLDKCGGLTQALAIARAAHSMGLEAMVGCMGGTSLGMAPGFVAGQLCKFVDLDAPALLKSDRPLTVHYVDGFITCPEALWGGSVTTRTIQ